MISGLNGWLSGPQITYASIPLGNASYHQQLEVLPSSFNSTEFYWGLAVRKNPLIADCWMNFTVSSPTPVNAYIINGTRYVKPNITQPPSSALLSEIQLTGTHVLLAKPAFNGTYYLVFENDLKNQTAWVNLTSSTYVTSPLFDYSTADLSFQKFETGIVLLVAGLLFSSPVVHRGLTSFYSLPDRVIVGRKKGKTTGGRGAVYVGELALCTFAIVGLAPIPMFRDMVGHVAFYGLWNFSRFLPDLGVRASLFFELAYSIPLAAILILTMFACKLFEVIIGRVCGFSSREFQVDDVNLRNVSRISYKKRYVLIILVCLGAVSIAGLASYTLTIIGLIFIGCALISTLEYTTLRMTCQEMRWDWGQTVRLSIRGRLKTLFAYIFGIPLALFLIGNLIPYTIDAARRLAFPSTTFMQISAQFMSSSIFLVAVPSWLAKDVLAYWSIFVVLNAVLYSVCLPYVMGIRSVTGNLLRGLIAGLVVWGSIELTVIALGLAESVLLPTLFAVSATAVAELLRRSIELPIAE